MTVESATLPADLNVAFPQHTDPFSETDGHLRLIKNVLKTTFPNLAAAVVATAASLNKAGTAFSGAITMIPQRTTTTGAQVDLMPSSSSGRVTFQNTGVPAAVGGLAIMINDAADANPVTAAVMTRAGDAAFASSVGAPNVNGTTGILQAGVRLIPAGAIIMWYGSVASIPAGWTLCDGTLGTPDLRERFIKGAGTTAPLVTGGSAATALTSGSSLAGLTTSTDGAHSHTGSTGSTAITEANLPAHTHTATVNDPGHGHTYNQIVSGGSGTNVGGGLSSVASSTTTSATGITVTNAATGSNTGHVHAISSDGSHSHTVASIAHTHTVTVAPPPFTALCFIMKT